MSNTVSFTHASIIASYAMSGQRQDLSLPGWSTTLVDGVAYILQSLAAIAGRTGLLTKQTAMRAWCLVQDFPMIQARARAVDGDTEGKLLVTKAQATAIVDLAAAKAAYWKAKAKALDAKSERDLTEAARVKQDIEIRQKAFDASVAPRDGSIGHMAYADEHLDVGVENGKPRLSRKEGMRPALALEVKTTNDHNQAAPAEP